MRKKTTNTPSELASATETPTESKTKRAPKATKTADESTPAIAKEPVKKVAAKAKSAPEAVNNASKPVAKKPTAQAPRTPQSDLNLFAPSAPPPLFGKKKPEALKSLAELIEEEKLNPKKRAPRPPAPKPEPTKPEPSKAADTDQSLNVQFRTKSGPTAEPPRERGPRGKKPQKTPQPQSVADLATLDGLETESFGDWLVYWRAADANRQPVQTKGRQPRETKRESTAEPQGAKKQGRRGRREPIDERPTEVIEHEITDTQTFGDEIHVQFRRRNETAAAPRKARAKETEQSAPTPPPVPEILKRPSIPIPDDAPQVVLRNGLPTLIRDKVVYPPIGFFGSAPDERRATTLLAEVRRAAEAGVHLHSILVEFEVNKASVDSSINYAAYMSNKIIEIDPKAQILFRIVLSAPRNWESLYPNAKYQTNAGRSAEPSVCDDDFWKEATDSLSEFILRMRKLDLNPNSLGVHLDRGEWFFPEGHGYDNSKAAAIAFRDWLRTRYVNDVVALRAAWFDGAVTFDSVQIPEFHAPVEGSDFMRTSRRERRWVDYHLFLSDAICARIADLAYAAKEASEGYYLVGVSYGYTFEWSHPASGHLSLGKLLRTREIDFIAGPPSYRSREPGGDAPFPCPIDSLALNGKLYISEEDFKTAIGDHKEPDDYNPVIKTPQALEALHWRGAGAALSHGSGMFWMDLWGNGWLNTATIWDRGAKVMDSLIKRMASNPPDPDVAVFIDERALAYLVDEHSFALLVQDVRESVLRSGLSAGFYLLSDLAFRDNFPDCKLSIFLNAWDIRPEHRSAIKTKLQKDGKVLFWLYCAGMFDNGRESLERAREVTGIAIKPQPFHSRTGTTILSKRHPLCEAFAGQGLIGGANVDPSYFAIPENAVVLGEYSQSGLPSFVIRDFNEDPDVTKHWKSVFLGEPFVTPGLLRALAQIAGCHIWNYHSDVVHVRPPFLSVHCTGSGARAIALPRNWEAYDLLTGQWVTEDSNTVRFQGLAGATHCFLVGDRHELEQIIAADPETWLRMEELPERIEDSSRDAMTFDVPIMRLDEVFGDAGEEVGDEWFLKPALIEEEETPRTEEESENKVVRRRRPRSNRKRGEERATGEAYDTELGMSVMFRKRE